MRAVIPRGTQKPLQSAPALDMQHPFARELAFALLFDHPFVRFAGTADSSGSDQPTVRVIWGRTPARTVNTRIAVGVPQPGPTIGSPVIATSNLDGPGLYLAQGDHINLGADPLPTGEVTFAIIQRRSSTSGAGATGVIRSNTTSHCGVWLPWNSDGKVYWEWGGTAAGSKALVSASAVSRPTTAVDRWVLTAGRAGMAIWLNGVKLASQSTANASRALNTSIPFKIGHDSESGFVNQGITGQLFFYQVNAVQWSDALCRWWSAQPYAALAAPAWMMWAVAGGIAPSSRPWLYRAHTQTWGAGFGRTV